MEDARSNRTVAAFLMISLALVVAIVLMHYADAAERADRARLEARVDDLSKRVATVEAEIASAPIKTPPLPTLADAAVGDYPIRLPPQSLLRGDPRPAPTSKQELGF